MALPTKAQWSQLKANANISKTPWYKKADAAVGPALAAVESAKAKWRAKNDHDNALNYAYALAKLHDAFTKFVDKKDLTNAGALAGQIVGWKTEVHTSLTRINSYLPALKSKDAKASLKAIHDINPFI